MNEAQKKRLSELLALRSAGTQMTATELTELSDLQAKQAEGVENFTFSAKALEELLAKTATAAAKEGLEEIAKIKAQMSRGKLFGNDAPQKKEAQEKVGQFFKALMRKDFAQAKALSEGTDSAGGYLVQEEFTEGIMRVADEFGLARRYASVYRMASDTRNVNTLGNSVMAYWVAEGAVITASNPSFGRKTITAKKLAAIIPATNELLDDADINVFEFVARLAAEAFFEKEDSALFNGGAEFTGILEDSDVNVVTMPTGDTSFADITYDNIVDLTRAAKTKYKRGLYKPRFYFNEDIMATIEKIKDTTGRPVFVPSPNESTPARLLGYEVELTEVMPGTADDAVATKFVAFGDLTFTGLGIRKEMTTELLSEGTIGSLNLAEQDEKALRVIERVGVVVLIGEALTVLKTSAI